MMMKATKPVFSLALAVLLFASGASTVLAAGERGPAQVPVALSVGVGPNLLFILDDSGSMRWGYMPDDLANGGNYNPNCSGNIHYGGISNACKSNMGSGFYLASSQLNNSYYNPELTYSPPLKPDGNQYPNASFTNAPVNGYAGACTSGMTSSNPCINLNDNYRAIMSPYNTGGTVGKLVMSPYSDPGRAFVYEFDQSRSGCGTNHRSNNCYSLRYINDSAEQQNFANWFSYYRTREMAAKAGISAAFHQLDETPRVGYATINKRGPITSASGGLYSGGVRPFYGENRHAFFKWLNDVDSSGNTPLRLALDDAGKYFTKDEPWREDPTNRNSKLIGCRQNYTVLMTDGYWNQGGPNVGDRDGDGKSNTLADVARHYWETDLRPDLHEKVPTGGDNPADWQHMVTFGVGLGVSGTLTEEQGFAMDPGSSSWPDPTWGDPQKIDDLLHASVNSYGGFFSAADPQTFADELANVLKDIMTRSESTTSGGTDSVRLDGDSLIYQASYDNVVGWVGEVTAESFDGEEFFKASEQLPAHGSRNIFTYNGSSGVEFVPGSVPGLNADQINYLRGDDTYEGSLYRERVSPLGDIVGSELVFSGAGNEGWGAIEGDNGRYFEYIGTTKNDPRDCADNPACNGGDYKRKDTVFVGANDGMLHAFDARTMEEFFAYVPSMVHHKLHKLTDPDYKHEYFVDGKIAVGDAYIDGGWKTILVGTLGAGGKGVFALDVTDPENFAASDVLWEIDGDKDDDFIGKLGYTFSQPAITRLANGKWVAIFGNGYYSGGDIIDDAEHDQARLLVVDLEDGELLHDIELGDKQPDTGLSGVSIWEDPQTRSFTRRVYAGDLKGTLWRVDFDESGAPQVRFEEGLFQDPNERPITASPTLGDNPAGGIMVYFGTGKLFDENDDQDVTTQAMFGVLDSNQAVSFDSLSRNTLNGVTGDIVPGTGGSNGWYVDLVHGNSRLGERVLHKVDLRFGVLVVSTSQPDADTCSAGIVERTYMLDALTGAGEEIEVEEGETVGREIVIIPPDPKLDPDHNPSRGDTDPGDDPAPSVPDLDDYDLREVGWCSKIALLKHGSGEMSYEVLGEICDGRSSWRELIDY